MQTPLDEAIKTYKKRSLPSNPKPNSIYYILPVDSTAVIVYVTDLNGIPIKVIDLTNIGAVQSVTGTAVTNTLSNPVVNISNFVSGQLGNLIKLSTIDGKLVVKAISSPNTSIKLTETLTALQIELSASIVAQINSALQPGDITQYTNELAQDSVGTILTDTTTIDFTYDDIAASISAIVKLDSIDATHLANTINNSTFINDSNFVNQTTVNLKVDKVVAKSLLSDTEITRLTTLANYTHPINHPPSIITQDISNRFVTDIEKSTWNAKQSALGYTAENVANKNIASGYAGLGSDGKIISAQLPSITISDTFVTATQTEMLAIIAQTGDVAVRTDLSKTFILKGTNPTLLSDWQELLTPVSAVTSVFGRNGAVTAQSGDYTALMVGAPSGSGNSTGTNTGDNATNTQYSGLVSNANHTGDVTGDTILTLATVNANIGSFGSASTVNAITVNAKGLVTAITNSPIQITEGQVTSLVSDLASKANIASPTFTGVPAAPTAPTGTNTTQLATTAFVATASSGNVKLVGDQNVSGVKTFSNKVVASADLSDVFGEGFTIVQNTQAGGAFYIKNNANNVFLGGFGVANNDVRFANYVSSGKIFFSANGSDRITLFPSGNTSFGSLTDDNVNKVQVTGSLIATSIIKSGATTTDALLAGGATLANPISGTGTTNFIPKWGTPTTQGNSSIFDNGNVVETSTPQIKINTNSGLGARFSIASTSLNGREYQIGSNFVTGTGEFSIYDSTAGFERLSISSSGVVMIRNLSGTGSRVVIADASGNLSATLANPISGTGTTNFIPKWTGAGTQGNSIISEVGTEIKINGTTSIGDAASVSQFLRLNNSSATANTVMGGIKFFNTVSSGFEIGRIEYSLGTTNVNDGILKFYVGNAGGLSSALGITQLGIVNISNLSGTGSRVVIADASGNLSAANTLGSNAYTSTAYQQADPFLYTYKGNISSNTNADNLTANGVYLNTTGNGTGNTNFGSAYSMISVIGNNESFGQVQHDYQSTGTQRSRVRYGGAFSAWKEVLDNTNFNSFALPLTGGTINGITKIQSQSGASALQIIGRSDNLGYIEFLNNNGTTVNSSINGSTNGLQFTGAAAFSSTIFASNTITTTGTSNSYVKGGVEIRGNSTTAQPLIGFHAPGFYGGALRMTADRTFKFFGGDDTTLADVHASGFFQSSDRRLKTVLKRDGDVAYFKWKDNRDTKTHIGYIAQEVKKEYPDQVQKDDKGMLSVNYIEVLVAKIQDLEKRIKQLEK